jgi:tRNA threonylcarbamoyladenosine biosynthesis protein TsaB
VRVLALDAATEACSVALLDGNGIIARFEEHRRADATGLLGMVDEVLAEAGISLTGLDGIAAGVGPGAFTGVRITVSVAQGLAFGAGLRVAPVSTLEALALQVMRGEPRHALACLDARMGEVYWGCFTADAARGLLATSGARVGPASTVSLPGAGRHHGIGRGFAAYPALAMIAGVELDPLDRLALPNAREIARLGRLRLLAGEGLDPADLAPMYLRDKVALTEAERAVN